MHYTNTLFNQLLNFMPKNRFNAFVGQHQADRYVKKLTAWNQFVLLLYAQATGKDSLREIETGFSCHQSLWYHLGISSISRSTLSDANKRRDHQIFEKLFYEFLSVCKNITPKKEFDFKNALYSLDSSTVSLCLSMFDWSKFGRRKGALKIHTLLNNRTNIPELLVLTEGKMADIFVAKKQLLDFLENGSVVVFDRGYISYEWWKYLDQKGLFFVSRTKSNASIAVLGQHQSPTGSILSDERVLCGEFDGMQKYGKELRRVKYLDRETGEIYSYITNNFELKAEDIALIYKERWQIELFFKWIKQNLKIKTFLGTSKNAVLSQIWVAMIYYLLLAYIKFQTKFGRSLLELTRMVKETLLRRINLIDMLSLTVRTIHKLSVRDGPQLSLL